MSDLYTVAYLGLAIIIHIQYICKHTIQMQADSVDLIRTVLLTSDFGSSTRGERHNSYYANPTPNVRHTLWCLRSLSVEIRKSSTAEISTSTQWQKFNCLPPLSNLNFLLTLFQNPQILMTISSGHDVIHTPASFPVWRFIMTMVIVISFVRERKLHQLTMPLNS